MLDEETIEAIVERVLRRLLVELASDGRAPVRLTPDEERAGRVALAAPGQHRPRPRQSHDHAGRLLTEDQVVGYHRRGVRVLGLERGCIVTPAAKDRARDLQVDLVAAD